MMPRAMTLNDALSPSQMGSRSPPLSNPSGIQQELKPGLFEFQRLLSCHELTMLTARGAIHGYDHDPIQETHVELSYRRMGYHTIPTRGLVFESGPTTDMLPGRISSESLALSPDAPINQALIEYEEWLANAMSTLRESLGKRQQSHTETNLIEEITLATEEVHAAKCHEWSHQLAEMQTSRPLPPFVIDSQCAIVDGG